MDLYQVAVEEIGGETRYNEWIVQGPEYDKADRIWAKYAQERAHEASVMWGFVEVKVTVSRYYPTIVHDKGVDDGISWIEDEFTYKCDRKEFHFTLTATFEAENADEAWEAWAEWLQEPRNIEDGTLVKEVPR